MNNKQFAPGRWTLAFLIVLLILSACQNEEQLDAEVATVEAAAESTEAPLTTQEPTEAAATAEPTPVPPTPVPTLEPTIGSETENIMTSFTSSDNSLNFVYPDGWSVEDTGSGRAILANSDDALTPSDDGALQSGDVRMNITLLPANMLADYGLHMGNSAEEALQFIPDSELFAAQQENTQVGEIQSLELENAANAAQMSIATSDQDGALITSMYSDQVVAFISVVAPTGEYTNFEESVHDIVDSISVTVTADELIALITTSVQE